MSKESRPGKGPQQKPAPPLVPPDVKAGEEKNSSRAAPLLILACGLILVVVALLVVFLPMREEPATLTEPLVSQPAVSQPAAPLETQPAEVQRTADDDWTAELNRLMTVWLQKQAEAEAVNIEAWGGDAYTEAVRLARECDRLASSRQPLPAKQSCEGAIEALAEVVASREVLFDAAVNAGLLAIEEADPETAASSFQEALTINPNDQRAIKGAVRAERLPDVLQALQRGQTLEKSGDLNGTLTAYTEAAELDPDFKPPQEARERLRASIAEQGFQQAMGRALQAMAAGKYAVAGSALRQAEKIRPGDQTVRDLKEQLAEAQRAARLTALRRDASTLEQQERWLEALNVCEEALTLDSQAAFALSCKGRVSLRTDLDKQLKGLLARPERLFADGPLESARQTLAYATGLTPRGPVLAAQIKQLDSLITQAEAEVEVVILSDGLTDVVVYHVGRLGSFHEKTLVLRTGDYTATGSRRGFRDVRQTLMVRPGGGKLVFTLRCEEPI
jgi:tetratricopeptide (TPR) repeat protein